MSKLYFKTGTMGCGKSLDLIRSVYNYRERGMDILVFKSSKDTRSNSDEIESRTGASIKARSISLYDNIMLEVHQEIEVLGRKISAIFIDEAQFLSEKQVEQLSDIATVLGIPVLAYGLKLDFQSRLFEGSKRLIELADDIQELRAICWCGSRSTQNARVVNDEIVRHGEQIQVGGNESYIALCTKHYKDGKCFS